jgi:hypothetical protein
MRTVLGRTRFHARGRAGKVRPGVRAGTRLASCAVATPGDGESDALDVRVAKVAATDADIARTARSGTADFTYPADIGVGFANRDHYTDAAGHQHRSVESGLIRGDWTITIGLQVPAAGRDPLADVVSLAQQFIATLHLPAHASHPYPAPVASALHS